MRDALDEEAMKNFIKPPKAIVKVIRKMFDEKYDGNYIGLNTN